MKIYTLVLPLIFSILVNEIYSGAVNKSNISFHIVSILALWMISLLCVYILKKSNSAAKLLIGFAIGGLVFLVTYKFGILPVDFSSLVSLVMLPLFVAACTLLITDRATKAYGTK
jgi:hypothetical protein